MMEAELKQLALKEGASLVGICSAAILKDKDFSDPRYLLPGAQSVISIAIPMDGDLVKKYLSKKDYLSFCHEEGQITKRLKAVAEKVKTFLEQKGFQAINCDCNFNYRNVGAKGKTIVNSLEKLIELINKDLDPSSELTEKEKKTLHLLKKAILTGLRKTPMDLVPNISHRCVAEAAGIGRIGWSGNLVTEQYGARVLLNSIITTAKLTPDSPLASNPCLKCKLCEKSCQGGLFSRDEAQEISIAGIEERIGKRHSYAYCIAICSGMAGQNKFKEWSTWSPFKLRNMDRLPLDESVVEYVQNMFADAVEQGGEEAENVLRLVSNTYLGRNDKPAEDFRPSCGFCQLVCGPTIQDKKESYKLILNSGGVDSR